MLAAAGNNTHMDPDLGDITLNLLGGILGPVEIIAIAPADGTLRSPPGSPRSAVHNQEEISKCRRR